MQQGRGGKGRGGEGRTFRERRWLPAARYMISGEASVSNCGAAAGVEEGQKPAVRGGARLGESWIGGELVRRREKVRGLRLARWVCGLVRPLLSNGLW